MRPWIAGCSAGWTRCVCVTGPGGQGSSRRGCRQARSRSFATPSVKKRSPSRCPEYRDRLRSLFAWPPRWIIGAAGRLSPEKGFDQLVDAAALAHRSNPGPGLRHLRRRSDARSSWQRKIAEHGLHGTVVLAGFRADLGRYLPHLDLAVIPSFTEGLPVILLEAFAAGVPVVATSVGGIPEVIDDGTQWLAGAGGRSGAWPSASAPCSATMTAAGPWGRQGVSAVCGSNSPSTAWQMSTGCFFSVLAWDSSARSERRLGRFIQEP